MQIKTLMLFYKMQCYFVSNNNNKKNQNISFKIFMLYNLTENFSLINVIMLF
jgi:hypothetical protein